MTSINNRRNRRECWVCRGNGSSSLGEIVDYLDIRKNACIDTPTLRESTAVVSLWGRTPWEVAESFGMKSMYSYGVDKKITIDCTDNNYCDMLNSSFAYLELGKCPFVFSLSFFIVDDSCKIRYETLKKKADKDVFAYKYKDYKSLIRYLEEKLDQEFDEKKFDELIKKSGEISSLISNLRKCDIDERRVYGVGYFSKFIFDIDRRIEFIKRHIDDSFEDKSSAKLQAAAGVYRKFDQLIKEGYFCEGEYHGIFTKKGLEYIDGRYKQFDFEPDYVINNCSLFGCDDNIIAY